MAKRIDTSYISFDDPVDTMPEQKKQETHGCTLSMPPAGLVATEPIERPSFRQSSVQHYFICPKKYKLYLQYKDFVEDKMAMRKGRIFETLVFGHKPGADIDDYQKNTIGKIKAETISAMQPQAEKVKRILDLSTGEAFVKLHYETGSYRAEGEIDFLGRVYYEGELLEAITDLKYTANIDEFWNKKSRKEEFLQGIWYPWVLYKMTGKLLPFVYLIVESTFEDPLIKQILVETHAEDFAWIEERLERITKDIFFEANVGEGCMGYKGFSKCSMMEWCLEGREYIEQPVSVLFSHLD